MTAASSTTGAPHPLVIRARRLAGEGLAPRAGRGDQAGVPGGWRFDGTVPWYTGWGLNDVMLLAGMTDADEVLFAFTETREQPGLRPSPPMRLAALTASRTVSLELDGLWLSDDTVALRSP